MFVELVTNCNCVIVVGLLSCSCGMQTNSLSLLCGGGQLGSEWGTGWKLLPDLLSVLRGSVSRRGPWAFPRRRAPNSDVMGNRMTITMMVSLLSIFETLRFMLIN